MKNIKVKVKRVRGEEDKDIPLPAYMTPQASGMDLRAAVDREVLLSPKEIKPIPTGISVALPPGFEGQIRPRSGLALEYGLGLVNSPGTIDSDFRGEIHIIAINFGPKPISIKRGERIAQMVLSRVYRASIELVDELDHTERGPSGFGHTGR
jgi:dUTP pyrophosphatase